MGAWERADTESWRGRWAMEGCGSERLLEIEEEGKLET